MSAPRTRPTEPGLPGPCHRINEGELLLLLHHPQATLQSGANRLGLDNGSLTVEARTSGQGGEVGSWTLQTDAHPDVLQRTLPHPGNGRLVPNILVVGAIVEHHHQ